MRKGGGGGGKGVSCVEVRRGREGKECVCVCGWGECVCGGGVCVGGGECVWGECVWGGVCGGEGEEVHNN